MEYTKIIQNDRSKMTDALSFFLSNKWRHNDITATVKYHLYVRQLLDFINTLLFKYFSLYVYVKGNLDLDNKFNNMTP